VVRTTAAVVEFVSGLLLAIGLFESDRCGR